MEEKLGRSGWLRAVRLAVALLVATWALLVLLARRLPPGLLRDLAGIVPDCDDHPAAPPSQGCCVGPSS